MIRDACRDPINFLGFLFILLFFFSLESYRFMYFYLCEKKVGFLIG